MTININKLEIGNRLQQIREKLRLSRRSFCEKYDIPNSTLADWETGKNALSTDGVVLLIKAYRKEGIKVSKKWLLTGQGKSPLDTALKLFSFKEVTHPRIVNAIRNNETHSLNQRLFDAVKNNRRYEVTKLINQGANLHKATNYEIHAFDDEENSLLHLAVLNASTEMIDLLLDKGMNINITNRRKESILHYATLKGHRHIIKFLIKKRMDANVVEIEGDTPLAWAAYIGQLDIFETLLSEKSNINHQNLLQNTPLHWAASKGHYEIIKLLIERKANLYLKNYQKKLAIDLAEENGHIDAVELLITEMSL